MEISVMKKAMVGGLSIGLCSLGLMLSGCSSDDHVEASANATLKQATASNGTCAGIYPSYWQDPAFPEQWVGQTITDAPPSDWTGPVFSLSDAYPSAPVDDSAAQPWRDSRFDALFEAGTSQEDKKKLAFEYGWLVMDCLLYTSDAADE